MPDISERLKKVLAAIHDESGQLLVTHSVYEVSGHGWLDQDTPNPEYIGHAMWQVNPPFDHDWEALFNHGTPPTYAPTNRDEVLVRTGEDFVGTMEFARRSLGMALCFGAVANPMNHISENREFWHEYATTAQWLNIASDRVRDYFLMARFEQEEEDYSKCYREKNKTRGVQYTAPFVEALRGAQDDTRELLSELSSIASELQTHRKVRNDIVHRVATQAAQQSIAILREQRELAKKSKTIRIPTPTYEDLQAHTASLPEDALVSEIETLKLWYTRLVKASSLVFEFEYLNRRKTS